VATQVELLILQHPLEVHHIKGSARLLHLCLGNSTLLVGERFDATELAALLHAGGRTPVLLYPDTPDHASLGLAAPNMLAQADMPAAGQLRLVVIDGTWRKSRKMLFANQVLQSLPRFALRAMPPSHYRVRKAHRPDQLSTLEAASYALAQLDGECGCSLPLLAAFDGFNDMLEEYQTPAGTRASR
jgi:DTW domain-containing protein YfiP